MVLVVVPNIRFYAVKLIVCKQTTTSHCTCYIRGQKFIMRHLIVALKLKLRALLIQLYQKQCKDHCVDVGLSLQCAMRRWNVSQEVLFESLWYAVTPRRDLSCFQRRTFWNFAIEKFVVNSKIQKSFLSFHRGKAGALLFPSSCRAFFFCSCLMVLWLFISMSQLLTIADNGNMAATHDFHYWLICLSFCRLND